MKTKLDAALTILVIDDDPVLQELYADIIKNEGWQSIRCDTSDAGINKAGQEKVDLILLDLNLPQVSGWDILKQLRSSPVTAEIPVFLITGEYVGDQNICRGLYAGADEYLTKPFAPEILIAKIRARLRRKHPSLEDGKLIFKAAEGKITLDSFSHSASLHTAKCLKYSRHLSCKQRGCRQARLTKKEFEILFFLMTIKRNYIVTRRQILDRVWKEPGQNVFAETVDKHIESLRRKLGGLSKSIKTVYGVGYQISDS